MDLHSLIPLTSVIRGAVGKSVIYQVQAGNPYRRGYFVPANPRTPAQQSRRAMFAAAVANWHALTPEERAEYNARGNRRRRRITGMNLLISEALS